MKRTLNAAWIPALVVASVTASAQTFYDREGVVFEGTNPAGCPRGRRL